MSAPEPHFLLYSASAPADPDGQPGDWRFVLESIDGSSKIEIVDTEPEVRGERLELLAVVRGLEAIDEPARVTLVTPSRYVSRGISYGLNDWRENGWHWERHGEMVPVKDRDLWQRVDRALEFHRVECRQWRLDAPHNHSSGIQSRARAPESTYPFASEPANEARMRFADTSSASDHHRAWALELLRRFQAWLSSLWHRFRHVRIAPCGIPRSD
jgi:ribonuclease HI